MTLKDFVDIMEKKLSADRVRKVLSYVSVHRVTKKLKVGLHSNKEMMQGAEMLSRLPIDFIKLHQLQILKGTRMAVDFAEHPQDFITFPTAEDYVTFVRDYIHHLRTDIKIERYVSSVSSDLIIAPRWGLKPYEIKTLIEQ